MKKAILGFCLVCLSLAISLHLGTSFLNAVLCLFGAFLFILGALQIIDKLDKLNEDDHD